MMMVRNGYDLLGLGSLKSVVSQNWIDEMLKLLRKLKVTFNNYWVSMVKNGQSVIDHGIRCISQMIWCIEQIDWIIFVYFWDLWQSFEFLNSLLWWTISERNKNQWIRQWICDSQLIWKLSYVNLLRIIVFEIFEL